MLKFLEVTLTSYDVLVESNNKKIGSFIMEVDGYYYFKSESEEGLWSDYVLLEIGKKLEELNKPWNDHLEEKYKNEE